MAKKIIRHELVEIQIPQNSTLTSFNFPDIPNLRDANLWGLQIYSADQVPTSIISGIDVIPFSAVKTAFFTLQNYSGKEYLKQAPALMFNTLHADASASTNIEETDIKAFVGQKTSWPKSKVEFPTAPASALKPLVVLVSVYYSYSANVEAKDGVYSFNNQK